MGSVYVTVAIPYVNADPHLGYAYELVLADAHARAHRASGRHVRFLGGTDDDALKNVLAAEEAGTPVRAFVDEHAQRFAALAEPLRVTFDDFIRTSADPRHGPAVHRLWRAVAARGDLYRRAYEGDYCVGCEQFYAPDDLVGGRCPEHGTATERVAEENWFFRLSRYQEHLLDLLSVGGLRVEPEAFRNEALAFVRAGLDDISVSRSAVRARGWGVAVPDDPDQVVYVWFDALTNYISALGYGDPGTPEYRRWWLESEERIHVIGKGILRFHAVFWPAFLLSAGEPLPSEIRVHPYLTAGGAKLSKSSGVAVDPLVLVDRYGVDAVRWWFARDVSATVDTDFTPDRLVARANTDLAGGVGNLAQRVVALVHRLRDGVPPPVDAGSVDGTAGLADRVRHALAGFDARGAAHEIVTAVAALNRDLEATAPWRLDADGPDACTVDAVLARHLRSLHEVADALSPLVPDLAARLRRQVTPAGGALPPPAPVFLRLEASVPTSG